MLGNLLANKGHVLQIIFIHILEAEVNDVEIEVKKFLSMSVREKHTNQLLIVHIHGWLPAALQARPFQ